MRGGIKYFFKLKYLRGSDSECQQSLDRLEKSKILKLCLKNTFGNVVRKYYSYLLGIYGFREINKKRK